MKGSKDDFVAVGGRTGRTAYRGAWVDMVVTFLKGRLALINPLDGDPGATRLTLAEIGPHAFRTESAAPFGQDGDTVVFELDATGRARSLEFAAERLERVSP